MGVSRMENGETERLIEEFMEAGLKAFKSERKRSSEARKLDRHETIELPPDGVKVSYWREFVAYKMAEWIQETVPDMHGGSLSLPETIRLLPSNLPTKSGNCFHRNLMDSWEVGEMKCYCCKVRNGTQGPSHDGLVFLAGRMREVRYAVHRKGKGRDEALETVGLPEKDMNLDWYRRVRRINGQTT